MHEANLLDDEKPSDFYPLWRETRAMPFRRTPYPSWTFENAIVAATGTLQAEADSERARNLATELAVFVRLGEWPEASGLWTEEHPRAAQWDESAWRGRSRVERKAFGAFWEGRLAPYLIELRSRSSDA